MSETGPDTGTRPSRRPDLERVLGHVFARPELLAEALSHPSALGYLPKRERHQRRSLPPRSYERLEFLGDRVLGLIIAEELWRRFPKEPEGHLTHRLAQIVKRAALVKVAQAIGLGQHMILSPAERAGGAGGDAALADCCEALIAAIYLDGGLDKAREVVLRLWRPLIEAAEKPPRDPKSALQEWALARGLDLPSYRVVEATGPDHARRFTIAVTVGAEPEATGTAPSKQGAELGAAAALLERLAARGG